MPLFRQHILKDYRDDKVIPVAMRRGTIIKLQVKRNMSNVAIIEASHYCPSPARFCAASFSNASNSSGQTTTPRKSRHQEGKIMHRPHHSPPKILEQSHELNNSLYVVFMDFVKAFDSQHRSSLWKIQRHHGIQHKLVNIIKALYENIECRVVHNDQPTEP